MTAVERRRLREPTLPRQVDAAPGPQPRSSAPSFQVLCEVYVAAVLVIQFSVFGTFLVGDIARMYPVLIAGGLGLLVLAPRERLLRTKLNIPLLVVVTWFALSVLWTANPPEWRRGLLRVGVLPVVTIIIIGLIPFDRLILMIKRLTVGVIAAIFIGTAISPQTMTFHIDDATGERSIPGWHGTFDHKNGMMGFLMVGLITFWVFESDRLRKWAITAVVMALAVLGQSGTGISTLVVIALAGFSLRLRQQASRESGGVFVIVSTIAWILMAMLVGLFGPTLVNFFGKDLTFTGRTTIWSATLRMIGRQPWTGYGLGGVWTNQALQPTGELTRLIGFRVGHAHNGVLELLIQVGIIGTALYLMMAAIGVRRLWRARFSAPRTARWGLLILLTMTLLSLSEAMTMHPGYATLLALFCVVPLGRESGSDGLGAAGPVARENPTT